MPVLLEKYVLPILAAVSVLVLITNPMKWAIWIRIMALVVLLVLAILVSLDLHRRGKNKESSAKVTSGVTAFGPPSSFTTPTPRDMYDRIKKLPLYEQEQAAQSYRDLPIHWPVRFVYMVKQNDEGDLYRVIVSHSSNDLVRVHCSLKLSEYPRLKLVHEGDTGIEITGTIREVKRYGEVILKDAKLIFTE